MCASAAGAAVVQILGGIGNPSAEVHATQLTRRLAHLLSGPATLLPAPGVVGSVISAETAETPGGPSLTALQVRPASVLLRITVALAA